MRWRHYIPYAAIQSINNFSSLSRVDTDSQEESIGGGAINEKQRVYLQPTSKDDDVSGETVDGDSNSWKPNDNLSHMLHALVGLDRYPNYLSRFRDINDMKLLEKAILQKASDVKRQREEICQRRNGIKQLVRRYASNGNDIDVNYDDAEEVDMLWSDHPILSAPKTWVELRERKILQDQAFKVANQSVSSRTRTRKGKSNKSREQQIEDTTIADIIEGKSQVDLDPALLEDWMNQEMFDVYSFPLLTTEFCALLRTTLRELSTLAELEEFAHLKLGRRVIDLDTIGLGWVTDLLFHMFIQPISKHLFATTEMLLDDSSSNEISPILDWRQGYVAGYSATPTESKAATRHRLVPHTDDSEVTLNCCIGEEDYQGGHVEFSGLRGAPDEGQLLGTAKRPNIGTALLHSGRHLHAVSDVTSGDRYALIVWTRS